MELWYELGRLYSGAGGYAGRAARLGFTLTLVTGSLVLLSAPLFGTEWAGYFAPIIPLVVGLLAGGGLFGWERLKVWRRVSPVRRALSERGLDPSRPARDGLGLYYDPHLILLRSEYEFLRLRGALRRSRIFEESFGFTPEDPFETGPLNVEPDTEEMRLLRGRWERRISSRAQRGLKPPELGLKEDLAYHVFPKELTVPVELAVRSTYLEISRSLLVRRYGRDPLKKTHLTPDDLRRRVARDLREHAALTEKTGPNPATGRPDRRRGR